MPGAFNDAARTAGAAEFRNSQFFRGIHMSIGTRAVWALALAAVSGLASADPKLGPNGRWYEVVADSGITWDKAKADAEARLLNVPGVTPVRGHLATINTLAEDEFIQDLNIPPPPGNRVNLWIGGFQQLPCNFEPGCGWRWINGELIADPNNPPPAPIPYTNWAVAAGEPDDANNARHLAIGPDTNTAVDGPAAGWYTDTKNSVWGYVVEYAETFAADDAPNCVDPENDNDPHTGGCILPGTGNGVLYKLPKDTAAEGEVVITNIWEVADGPTRCAANEKLYLNLQGPAPFPLNDPVAIEAAAEVVVSNHTCGYLGKLIVVKTETGVEVPSGVVATVVDTKAMLGNGAHECTAKFPNNDISLYQYDVKEDMVEAPPPPTPTTTDIDGFTTNNTVGCATLRSSGPKGSYHVFGTAFFVPEGVTPFDQGIEVLVYQIEHLIEAINEASIDDAFSSNGDFTSALQQAEALLADIRTKNLKEGSKHVLNLQRSLDTFVFSETDTNWQGELDMRADSVAHLLAQVREIAPRK